MSDYIPENAGSTLSVEWIMRELNRISGVFDVIIHGGDDNYYITIPGRVRWLFDYNSGDCVSKNDMVREDAWTMIANKDTCDAAAPQPVGQPFWQMPDFPAWAGLSTADTIYTSMRVSSPPNDYLVQKIRVWIPDISADAKYQVLVVDHSTDAIAVGNLFSGDIFANTGWHDAVVTPTWLTQTSDYSFILAAQNSSGNQEYNHPWVYLGISNRDLDPGEGNLDRRSDHSTLRVNVLDDDLVDRYAELANVIPGAILRVTDEANVSSYLEYEVITSTDNNSWFSYQVVLVDTGAAGEPPALSNCQLYFTVPILVLTEYVTLTDAFLNNPYIKGGISFGDVENPIYGPDGYGIDVLVQRYEGSEDWSLVALSSASGGGGSSPWVPVANGINYPDGFVGINQPSPVVPLDVNGAAYIHGSISTNNHVLSISPDIVDDMERYHRFEGSDGIAAVMGILNVSNPELAGMLSFYSIHEIDGRPAPITFQATTGNTGRVGIGTATPKERLEVAGNTLIDGVLTSLDRADITSHLIVRGTGAQPNTTAQVLFYDSGGAVMAREGFIAAGTVYTIQNMIGDLALLSPVSIGHSTPSEMLDVFGNTLISGKVGIGPGGSLQAAADINGRVRIQQNNTDIAPTSGVGLEVFVNSATVATLQAYDRTLSAYIQLRLNALLYVSRADGVANVGIGTASPSEKLEVAGKTKTSTLNISSIPTADTGVSGDVWSDGGTLKIVP